MKSVKNAKHKDDFLTDDPAPAKNTVRCQRCGQMVSTAVDQYLRPAYVCMACAQEVATKARVSLSVVGNCLTVAVHLGRYRAICPELPVTVRALMLASGSSGVLEPTEVEEATAIALQKRCPWLLGSMAREVISRSEGEE